MLEKLKQNWGIHMFNKILDQLDWSEPRIVYTDSGNKMVQDADPTEEFWACWRLHKNKLKEKGISVSKYTGAWKVSKWDDVPIGEKRKEIKPRSIKLENDILYDYQSKHTRILISDLMENGAALDASDTGTGKTFCAFAIAQHFNLYPIIVTPKTVIPSWKKVAKYMGIKDYYVMNYEQYRNDNTPYVVVEEIDRKDGSKRKTFEWNVEPDDFIIFDEGHRCKNHKTQNSKILEKAKDSKAKVLVLSATIADNPLQMYALGIVLGLFYDKRGFWSWAKRRGVYDDFWGKKFLPSKDNLRKIHEDIFPRKGHRIAIKDLGDKFPKNLVISDIYDMNSAGKEIQAVYDEMRTELSKLKEREKTDGSSVLTEILRARQRIELLKVPTLAELAEDHVAEGMSAAIFVNFEETVQALSKKLDTNCIITGAIKGDKREENRIKFQEGKERIIVMNIRAGGAGISLHDEFGNYPRVSIISPTYSAQDLKQALGRIHRAGAKSPALQKIIFAAGTIEEKVADRVADKIKNIDGINSGDIKDEDLEA